MKLESEAKVVAEGKKSPPIVLIGLAFLALYIIWGTTYLAMKFGAETIPPFTMAGIRFLIAGTMLMAVMRMMGKPLPTKSQWIHGGVVGTFLMVGGNGFICFAQLEIPSGTSALVVATMPLWMAFFNFITFDRKRLPLHVILGLLLGFIGTIILVFPKAASEEVVQPSLLSIVVLVLAPASWSIGSLYSRNGKLHPNPFMSTASQMIVGAISLAVVSVATGEIYNWDPSVVSLKSLLSVVYLVFFGAMIGLTSYVWLLKHCQPNTVATYTYVNPVIALLLGWWLGKEALSQWTFVSAFLILSSVFLIAKGKK